MHNKANTLGYPGFYTGPQISDQVGAYIEPSSGSELDARIDRIVMLSEVAAKSRAIAGSVADRVFGEAVQGGSGLGMACEGPKSQLSRLDVAIDALEREIRQGQEQLVRIAQL